LSCATGTLLALYEMICGGSVPRGSVVRMACETALICAIDAPISLPG